MDYQRFSELSQQIDSCLQAGKLKDAETLILDLLMQDISELDRAELCAKMAYVYDRYGNVSAALEWLDKGIFSEQLYARYAVLEKKASYLIQLGRYREALKLYEDLSKQPYLTEAEKERVKKVIQSLLGKTMGGWR
ncbi:MAG: hypothetical protein N2049_12005 [Anaerolineales bacterium]|nr:hypothetical protein [Anaerolineales bacterium]MCX7609923.1 hypothetical protein [Anaerolineales bacterium]MDW8226497.1 hypothetical protein [Anaerolineales bacterium]